MRYPMVMSSHRLSRGEWIEIATVLSPPGFATNLRLLCGSRSSKMV